MGAENKKIIGGIVADEPELNALFQEALSGIRDDINEAQQNVELYLDAILNSTGGKEMYGPLYNDALKIKGSARDKQLKFLDMFKDRVTKKEIINANVKKESDAPFDHSELNKVLEEMSQGRKYESVKPIITQPIKKIDIVREDIAELDEDVYDEDTDIDIDEDLD
jgi:hypothetical protein